jgi:hypothetical protein
MKPSKIKIHKKNTRVQIQDHIKLIRNIMNILVGLTPIILKQNGQK